MAVESVTYITDFVTTNPVGATDTVSTLDNHIRNMKIGIGGTFPNFTGIAMTSTEAELNILDGATCVVADLNVIAGLDAAGVTPTEMAYINGVTSAIQTQLTNGLARANHTGTQAMATISDAGALATLDSVAGAQIDANAVEASEIATNAVGTLEITTAFAAEANSGNISAGTSWTIPAGHYMLCVLGSGEASLELYSGSTWRAATQVYGGGFVMSDGTNFRIRETGAVNDITVYYRSLAAGT